MTELQVQNYLINNDIKPSLHRIAIMKYLLEHFNHPSVDIIYNKLYKKIPSLSKTTIYNTLKLFVEKKAIIALNIEEKNLHYDANIIAHSHLICVKCEKIFDIPLNNNINFINENLNDYTLLDTQIYHKGICPKCRKKLKL